MSVRSSAGAFPRLRVEYCELPLRLELSSSISACSSMSISIVSLSFSFSLLELAPFLLLLRLVVASSFGLFFLLFVLGFALAILRSLLSICIGDVSRSRLPLSVSPSWLGFPFGLPVGLRIALLLSLLSVVSVSIPSVWFVVFAVLSVVCGDRGGKLR